MRGTSPLALWEAGDCRCGICGQPVVSPVPTPKSGGLMPTTDHVFPKNPRAGDLRKLAILRKIAGGDRRRKVIAHRKCNNRKSNRPPTGCEVIFLMGVNARLRGRSKTRDRRRAARIAQRLRDAAALLAAVCGPPG